MSACPTHCTHWLSSCPSFLPLLPSCHLQQKPHTHQSIEHLRWDERKLDKVFNFDHVEPKAAAWLGQEQLQEIQHNLDVR